MKFLKTVLFSLIFTSIFVTPSFSLEQVEYKQFKFEKATCYVGVLYKTTAEATTIGVSAIATGMGSQFRKWEISDIKLNIGGEKIRPDTSAKFYVKKESFFRVPAAVLFAVLGAQVEPGGSDLERGVAKAGMAFGLGLLVLQAEGDIAGQKSTFDIGKKKPGSIVEGRDAVEIIVENDDLHVKETIRIGLSMPLTEAAPDYSGKTEDELAGEVDLLKGQISSLEKEQQSYKYGADPEYDLIQRKIEYLETERGLAYKTLLERRYNR